MAPLQPAVILLLLSVKVNTLELYTQENISFISAQESCGGTDNIRLTRFSSDTVGRLEVCEGGLWGTVCGNGATGALVKVVCRQLNNATTGG